MTFNSTPIQDVSRDNWDAFCVQNKATLNHFYDFLEYSALSFGYLNKSFLITLMKQPLAIVPLFIPISSEAESPLLLAREPLPSPIFDQSLDVRKPDFLEFLISEIQSRISLGVKEVMYKDSNWFELPDDLALEILFSSDFARIVSRKFNLILNLDKSEELLFKNLSRGHARTIKGAVEQGQSVKVIDSRSAIEEIDAYFNNYQDSHKVAAGRLTRPQASFDYMKDLIGRDRAALFVNELANRKVSFLYCDFYGDLARGWSQVNATNLEAGLYPRHLTEWKAILYFKSRGVRFYHIGSIDQELSSTITKKELGIQDYKLRFHSAKIPELIFGLKC